MITRDLDFFLDDGRKEMPSRVSAKEVRCKVALPISNLPGLDLALNPYVGCEHGCVYCFAPDVLKRDRSDWATRVDYRANLPVVLSRELRTKRGVIGIGTVTDPYQPLEEVLLLTRKCLMEISRHDNPISILTKSDLVLRDLELIIATRRPEVGLTVTCMDEGLAKRIEPGAPSPRRRIAELGEMSRSGVNSYAMIGPVLPFLEDQDLTAILKEVKAVGCGRVMVDRLRPRPGLEEALLSARVLRTTSCLTDFSHMGRQARYIRDECLRLGLRYESAF
jgi:DNA repair photolyase